MKIAELITLAENKLMALNDEMTNAIQRGDVDGITKIETQVAETQITLDYLKAI